MVERRWRAARSRSTRGDDLLVESPREMAAAPAASARTGRAMRLATRPHEPAEHEGRDRQRPQLQARPPDLSLHAAPGDADADRPPIAGPRLHGHGEVVDRLARVPPSTDSCTRNWPVLAARCPRRLPGRARQVGLPAVADDPRLGVEDDRVDHVGLSGDLAGALLEHRVVVEEERAGGQSRPGFARSTSPRRCTSAMVAAR